MCSALANGISGKGMFGIRLKLGSTELWQVNFQNHNLCRPSLQGGEKPGRGVGTTLDCKWITTDTTIYSELASTSSSPDKEQELGRTLGGPSGLEAVKEADTPAGSL